MSTDSFPDDLAIRLEQFYRRAGQDTTTMANDNPYSSRFDNPGGRIKRVLLESGDPQLAADCQAAIGGQQKKQTLAYRAAIARGDNPAEFTGALKAEYQQHNPGLVATQQQEEEQRLLAKFERLADQSRRRRDGDAAIERQSAKAKAEQEARQESLARHQALQQRIEARQARDRAMNPGF